MASQGSFINNVRLFFWNDEPPSLICLHLGLIDCERSLLQYFFGVIPSPLSADVIYTVTLRMAHAPAVARSSPNSKFHPGAAACEIVIDIPHFHFPNLFCSHCLVRRMHRCSHPYSRLVSYLSKDTALSHLPEADQFTLFFTFSLSSELEGFKLWLLYRGAAGCKDLSRN